MADPLILDCPIRGILKAKAKSADGLSPSEEKLRIDAIRHLISQGYPKENIKVEAVLKKFGHGGKNSFRADLAALDVPVAAIAAGSVDDLLAHAVVLGEIKRDHSAFDYVKHTQVQPMLDFAARDDCVGLYWDDIQQRVFWTERVGGKRKSREGALALLPKFGFKLAVTPLTFDQIAPTDSLLGVFERVEDILHASAVDPEQRFGVMLQLLLAKLFDEHSHEATPKDPLDIQDFKALGTPPAEALKRFTAVLKKAIGYYGKYLPRPVPLTTVMSGSTLLEVSEILAPVKILASKQNVVQAFYMYFAKHLYRWDLAQYFTPTLLTDFIVEVLNPAFGEHVKDPACGSADFLTSAFRRGKAIDPKYADLVWGSDNSENAVQVAVLNMVLNGDGKTNIKLEDSLEKVSSYFDNYDILICNPPFGTKIVENRKTVLSQFALGHLWTVDPATKHFAPTATVLEKQETGVLFVEVCVLQAKPGGRIGIILPNGYLGNRSNRYAGFREWLLRNCKVASICAFPRFTFKTSGADVSASVVFLEKREVPLAQSDEDATYEVHIGMLEMVGWKLGDKRAEPIYVRDPADGSYLVGADGERVLSSDFAKVLAEARTSPAAKDFPWLAGKAEVPAGTVGWSVPSATLVAEPTLCLDPKRYCRKAMELRNSVLSQPSFRLGDVLTIIPEAKPVRTPSKLYRYVEIEWIGGGDYSWTELRGWELPDRAKHTAEVGDIFVGSIWSSVTKWCMTGGDCTDLLVTNGCHRLRVLPGKDDYLIDVVAGLCSELYASQMRSLARGSDGLAEITEQDILNVVLPRISDPAQRAELKPFVDQLLAGNTTVAAKVRAMIEAGTLPIPSVARRPAHSALV